MGQEKIAGVVTAPCSTLAPPPGVPLQVQVDQRSAPVPRLTTLQTELSLQQPRPAWQGSGTQETPSWPAHRPSSWVTVRPRVQVPPTHDHWLQASEPAPSSPGRETPGVLVQITKCIYSVSEGEKLMWRTQLEYKCWPSSCTGETGQSVSPQAAEINQPAGGDWNVYYLQCYHSTQKPGDICVPALCILSSVYLHGDHN